jgi:DNA-binding XRE family transcriptional regulator
MLTNRRLIPFLNTLLDQERDRRGLPRDAELAQALGVSAKTLSLWRNGRSLPKAAIILLTILAGHGAPRGGCSQPPISPRSPDAAR